MGKWTADYYDGVLTSKIKSLVEGSITRGRLEKSEPSISYEAFVEDLDGGDSFTASLVDVLVKVELAERKTRAASADRRLIADRTAKNLRLLATPLRVYQRPSARSEASRRAMNLSEFLSASHDEIDVEEEDDDFDLILDNAASAIEGARVNTDLYDAYAIPWPSAIPSVQRRSNGSHIAAPTSSTTSGATSDTATDGPTPASSTNRTPPWTFAPMPAAPSTSLQRQPSLRRPSRSFTVDFNDFTSRRRSLYRQGTAQEPSGPRPGSEYDDFPLPLIPTPGDEETSSSSPPVDDPSSPHNLLPTRRFFPMPSHSARTRSRREAQLRRHETGSLAPAETPYSFGDPISPGVPWYALPTPVTSSSSRDTDSSEERAVVLPPSQRLRRGGIRAPESMLSRHASPLVDLTEAARVDANTTVPIHMPPSPQSPARYDEAFQPLEELAAVAVEMHAASETGVAESTEPAVLTSVS